MSSGNCQKHQAEIAIITEESSGLAGTGKDKPRKKIVKKRGEFVRITQVDSKKYTHGFGEKYPGLIVGHDSCKGSSGMVPKYMGWLWNVETLGINKVRKGWCPGAISKPINEIMQQFLNPYPCQTQNNFCGDPNEPAKSSDISAHDLNQNSEVKGINNKSKETLCEKCQGKAGRDMDTQYDINDVEGVIQNDEKSGNTESADRKGTTLNNDVITKNLSSDNNDISKMNQKSIFQSNQNDNRKSAFEDVTNGNRKSVFQGTKTENRKSEKEKEEVVEKSMNQELKKKSTPSPEQKRKSTLLPEQKIKSTAYLEQKRKSIPHLEQKRKPTSHPEHKIKSTANPGDIKDKTPRKSK